MASTQPGSSPSSAAFSKAKAYFSESVDALQLLQEHELAELSIQLTTKIKNHTEPCGSKESPKSQNKYEVPVANLMQNTHEVKKATEFDIVLSSLPAWFSTTRIPATLRSNG
jgi:hypothetical protein